MGFNLMDFQDMDTKFVLQGEVGIWEGIENLKIHTPTPTSCTVLTLYDKTKKIGAMAHIDDYTSVKHVFFILNEQAQTNFGHPLNALNFKATVIGGTSNQYSVKQQKKIIELLNNNNIEFQKMNFNNELSEYRPQIVLNTDDGAINSIYGDEKNYRLEYLQTREYYFFNNYQLDTEYPSKKGENIPFFESIIAIRSARVLPPFEMKDMSQQSIEAALALEDSGQLKIPAISWKRTAISTREFAIANLNSIITNQRLLVLTNSFQERNFNLLLRQSCSSEKRIELTRYLVAARFVLGIDLNSKGKTSGTALEVALSNGNDLAVNEIKTALRK